MSRTNLALGKITTLFSEMFIFLVVDTNSDIAFLSSGIPADGL